ncbi:hypothetical protein IIB34_05435 [PVC group bacterium]|nr:hypothetical protein [PVC group bacterium]
MMKRIKCINLFSVIFSFLLASQVSAATITGKINFEGDVPKLREIKMEADPICLMKHDSPVYSQALVLGEGNTMANVFVHVVGGSLNKDYPVPTEPVVLDQNGCMYVPHVLGVRVGQSLKILNSDGTLHNVHGMPKVNDEFNMAMPKFRKKMNRTFDKAEFMFAIKCDVHPWMGAWVAVMEHPFFNVTKEDGVFTINDLPAGEYEIEAWHEKLGTKKVSVILSEGESKDINFTFLRE